MLTCPTCSKQFAAPAPAAPQQAAAPPPARPQKKPPQVQKPPQLQKPVQPQALASQLTPISSQPQASLAPLTPAYRAPVYPQSYGGTAQGRGPSRGLIIGLSAAGGGLVLIVALAAVGFYVLKRSFQPLAQNPGNGSLPGGFNIPSVNGLKPNQAPETLDDCIADIRISEPTFSQVYLALIKLGNMEPVEARREEVAGLLDPLLTAKDSSVRNSALRTVKKWGTQKNVATLSKMMQSPTRADRHSAMDALGAISSSQQAAEALAKQLLQEDDRYAAARALGNMGPIAEDIVWPHVESTNSGVRSSACTVLGKVGTQKSLQRLKALIRSEPDIVRRSPLEVAESEIERRLDKTEGSGGIFD